MVKSERKKRECNAKKRVKEGSRNLGSTAGKTIGEKDRCEAACFWEEKRMGGVISCRQCTRKGGEKFSGKERLLLRGKGRGMGTPFCPQKGGNQNVLTTRTKKNCRKLIGTKP